MRALDNTSPLTLTFEQVTPDDYARTGGKGQTLALLCQAGFPVPPGFIVITDAYRVLIEANHLGRMVSKAVKEGCPPVLCERIRIACEEAALPEMVVAAIGSAYRRLGADSVAVRSSALAEDRSLSIVIPGFWGMATPSSGGTRGPPPGVMLSSKSVSFIP